LYPVETNVAEKLHAYTLPRSRPNSRIKDLPDLALLATVRDFDSMTLLAAIEQTVYHRSTPPVPVFVPDPPETWDLVYTRIAENDAPKWPGEPQDPRRCTYQPRVRAGRRPDRSSCPARQRR
jgi:hypothetical protein